MGVCHDCDRATQVDEKTLRCDLSGELVDVMDWCVTRAEVVKTWPQEVQFDFEERAAIMEHDGGMTRAEAERDAFLLLEPRMDDRRET